MHIEPTPSALLALASEQQQPLHETFAAAWLAAFISERTRAAYSNNIRLWFGWCETNDTDPLRVARMATYYCHGPARSVTHAVAGVVLSS